MNLRWRSLRSLAGRTGAIKPVLAERGGYRGIGNIYADEALYYASIHSLRPASSLTQDEVRLLRDGIVAVTLGIEHGGTSFNEYRDVWGEAGGQNYNHVQVYQQDGKPVALWHTD